jgi:hypothetical protein
MRSREEDSLVERDAFRVYCQSQHLQSKQGDFLPIISRRECVPGSPLHSE